jgi:uncharacterized tellurite resistance protein B-like protein
MIGILKNFFTNEITDLSSPNIQPHRLHVATCAILLEMAKIDCEFDDSERNDIITIFKDKYNLTDDEVTGLIEASEEELERSIDLWQFTNQINKNYSPDEKNRIIETIWQIAYADGKLDKHEDYLIHKLSDILNISHKHLIEAKLKVLHCNQLKEG